MFKYVHLKGVSKDFKEPSFLFVCLVFCYGDISGHNLCNYSPDTTDFKQFGFII